MAQVVEGALIAADGKMVPLQWIETRKLLETIRLETAAGPDRKEVAVRYRPEALPSEFRGRSALLAAGLTSLLDCARMDAPAADRIELKVMSGLDSEERPTLEFLVETFPTPASEATSHAEGSAEDRSGQLESIALSEAIAADVARAHEGDLVIERDGEGRPTRRLRIPTSL